MVNHQTKTFSFKIIHQAKQQQQQQKKNKKQKTKKKNVFPSDVERTIDAESKSLIHLSVNIQKINKERNLTDLS